MAELYRRACEHLALARARTYPRYLLDRLDKLTADAHQVIYQRREFGAERASSAPSCAISRARCARTPRYVWTSAALFVLPMLLVGWLVYERPDLILSVVERRASRGRIEADVFRRGGVHRPHARRRTPTGSMFGFYIQQQHQHRVPVFRRPALRRASAACSSCVFNGVFDRRGRRLPHRARSRRNVLFLRRDPRRFELTAIVLSGAAGLRLGHALLAPGRNTRLQSLTLAARETIVIVYGVVVMLLIAAAIEAFWSSARWLPLPLKYSVAGVCWIAVLDYLVFQGRRAD